ncbi:25899_t:CDS:2 [Gigaspora margarita]|uniref:25899_t:CDS:1 n=1 Tax=Gigaspora margarita TaxID=4874 RepID=A0ABM8W1R8_GIGMA|nr:25899_t:CDS:2 [Gigaspora margarita]
MSKSTTEGNLMMNLSPVTNSKITKPQTTTHIEPHSKQEPEMNRIILPGISNKAL